MIGPRPYQLFIVWRGDVRLWARQLRPFEPAQVRVGDAWIPLAALPVAP